MAFSPSTLTLIGGYPGKAVYRYDTLDALSAVDAANYFLTATSVNGQNFVLGDLLHVVVWATAIGTGGTISDYGMVLVNAASATAVDTTNDLIGITPTDTD